MNYVMTNLQILTLNRMLLALQEEGLLPNDFQVLTNNLDGESYVSIIIPIEEGVIDQYQAHIDAKGEISYSVGYEMFVDSGEARIYERSGDRTFSELLTAIAIGLGGI